MSICSILRTKNKPETNDQELTEKLETEHTPPIPLTTIQEAIDSAPTTGGILRFRTPDGKTYTFQGNRAERRRFIRENKLTRSNA